MTARQLTCSLLAPSWWSFSQKSGKSRACIVFGILGWCFLENSLCGMTFVSSTSISDITTSMKTTWRVNEKWFFYTWEQKLSSNWKQISSKSVKESANDSFFSSTLLLSWFPLHFVTLSFYWCNISSSTKHFAIQVFFFSYFQHIQGCISAYIRDRIRAAQVS